MPYEYTYDEESKTLKIDCSDGIYGPSIEDFPEIMDIVIKRLMQVPKATRIILTETRDFEYGYEETKMLKEIADLYVELVKKMRIHSLKNLSATGREDIIASRLGFVQKFINTLTMDPVKAYRHLLREIRHTEIRSKDPESRKEALFYLNNLLKIRELMESTQIIRMAMGRLSKIRGRSIYRELFHPTIRPNFMYTKYMAAPPKNAELLKTYKVGDAEVSIFRVENSVRNYYHLMPPEFNLSEEEYYLVDTARRYMTEHKPTTSDLTNPERIRESFFNIGRDLLYDISQQSRIEISSKRIEELARILTRYTAGFGILEIILQDENVQDVIVNAPVGESPVFLFHGEFEDCETNIVPTREDANLWATRFRLQSGRPLDEANPVLDTEMVIPGATARVAAITRSLSPYGLAFAFRRHREKPWTFPLFISNRFMNPLAAGLIWFFVDSARTMLIAGTRGAGKSSLLGSIMVQIMPRYRIITVEDTMELPVNSLRRLGYNIQPLKARSIITHVETELPADEALRTSLRLGDSALIIGEVRSKEALALYEAMRIGALANVVAGTIHGDSAYGVFDRVVNDLGVPRTSFKATDLVIVANRLKSPDGLRSFRRVVEITEIRKHWEESPVREGGFVNLMEYSAKEDSLKPTDTLLTGESYIMNSIANRVREWKGNWDTMWSNINLRARVMKTISDFGSLKPQIMEAEHVVRSNSIFHIKTEEVLREIGTVDSEEIYARWLAWFKDYARKVS